jgi:hypothetical protein
VLRSPSIADLDADTLVARFPPTIQRCLTAPLPVSCDDGRASQGRPAGQPDRPFLETVS